MTKAAILPEIVSVEDLGGTKLNAFPVEDSATDLESSDWNETAANVAALSHTAPRALLVITLVDDGSYELTTFDSVWGSAIEPVVSRDSDGVYDIVFDTSVSDLLIESGDDTYSAYEEHDLAFRACTASLTGPYICSCEKVAGNQLLLTTYTLAGAADDLNTVVTILVF